MNWVSRPLSWAYTGAIQLRNGLFNQGILKSQSFSQPVISIGNISVGGTGKTPVIQALLEWSLAEGLRPGVVSRGYGGNYKDVQEVSLKEEQAATVYGDEPVLIKKKFPTVPYFVCRERSRAVGEMLGQNELDIVLADDAFQHRALSRDLDVVLIDAEQEPDHYQLLPLGRLREPLSQLSRADFIVVTKWNLADVNRRRFIAQLIEENSGEKLRAVIHCDYEIINMDSFTAEDEVILFSGIGNPKAFEKLMSSNAKIISHKVYKDHYSYSQQDIENLLSLGKTLVTTEKDAVKLKSLDIDLSQIKVAQLGLKFDSNMKKLFGAIHEKLV